MYMPFNSDSATPTSLHFDSSHPHASQQQQHQQYPFAFDTSYGADRAGPSSAPGPSDRGGSGLYEYSYARGPQSQGQQTHGQGVNVNVNVNAGDFQSAPQGQGQGQMGNDLAWGGAGASTSEERSTSRDLRQWSQQHESSQQGGGNYDVNVSGSGSSMYQYSTPFDSSTWTGGKGASVANSHWPDEYVGQSSSAAERELNGLQMTLSELVESIRPYATSPSNPRPPPPPPYLQARFLRLASTVQTSLSSLQPSIHPTLHPAFNLPAPRSYRNTTTSSSSSTKPNGNGNGDGMSSAEKEMEVIRKRRDMLIARAAQVQASSHPAAVHHSQLPANWNHGELYQNGAGVYSNGPGTSTAVFPPYPNDNGSPSLNSSRRSTITLENFDASLARFSLDPTKIGQGAGPGPGGGVAGGGQAFGGDSTFSIGNGGTGTGAKTKAAPEGGRCHGCGASATPEWRMGPDGPRSLCNACGLHYAKITRRRAAEEASANGNDSPFPPSMITTSAAAGYTF